MSRTLTKRQANIAHAIAVECTGWDTHPLYELAYDGAVDGLVRACRQFDEVRFREDQFDGWLVYCARREAWNRIKKRIDRKVKKEAFLDCDYHISKAGKEPQEDRLTPVDELIEGAEWAFLRKALSSLSVSEAETLHQYFSGKNTTEYALSIGLKSRQAVYHRVRRIIERLREMAERECVL